MFLRNEWYVGALAADLQDRPVARWLLGEPVVLYRTASGTVAALEDRCPHRGAALSAGDVHGEHIACGYHGFRFDPAGRCVHVPGMDHIPAQARVRSFPAIERWGFVFVWMGDPAAADEARLPEFHWMTAAGWTGGSEYLHVKAHYTLVRDNLLDLTHARFVHKNTLATSAVTEHPIRTTVADRRVSVLREMPSIEASPFFRRLGGFAERVDHRQQVDFMPPCYVVVSTRVTSVAGSGEARAAEFRVLNALTPERAGATHYFWGLVRNFAIGDAHLTMTQQDLNRRTFDEDVAILEGQQARIDTAPAGWRPVPTPNDGGCVQAERMMARLQAAEPAAAKA